MAKSWRYAGDGTRVGLMICTACHKPIGEADGDFRYRETNDAYLPQHRACSPGDPEWAKIDARRQDYAAYWARREAAMQAFVNEFGAPDDGLIDECMANRPTLALSSKHEAP
jgi:hypothetical protein